MEHTHTHKETHETFKMSGNDVIAFLQKIFKAGSSRTVVWRSESGKKAFGINLIILTIIYILIPFLAILTLVFLIITNFSLSIERRA